MALPCDRSWWGNFLYQNVARGGVAEGDARATHLTNDRSGAGNFCHTGGFTEAHLAHALAKMRIAGETAYSASRTRIELAQGRRRGGGLAIHRSRKVCPR